MTSRPVFLRRCKTVVRPWLFPLGVGCLYGAGMMVAPEKTIRAWSLCCSMAEQLAIPLCLALVTMVAFNRYVSPALVARFLGQNTGLKGILLSSLAGILSMGPIYAWYPLFKSLKDKGAATFIIANFIGCRSIKPPLFPVLIGYFGWRFASVFVVTSLTVALATASIVARACPSAPGTENNGPEESGKPLHRQ